MAPSALRPLFAGGLGLLLVGCGSDSTEPSGQSSIRVAASEIAFFAPEGGASPTVQTVAVTSGTTGVLTGLAVGSITYGAGSGWLHGTLDKTSAPATLTLAVTTGTLTNGIYTATVPITSPRATNSPVNVAVSFVVLGNTGSTTLSVAGESAAFLDSPNFGTRLTLQPGSQYLIAVVNTSPSPSVHEDFRLAGALATGTGSLTSLVAATEGPTPDVPPRGTQGPTYAVSAPALRDVAAARRRAETHLKVIDLNRQVYARFGRSRPARTRVPVAGARIAPLSASMTPTVGTVTKVYVRNRLMPSCTDVDSTGARVVAVGQHVLVLADTNLTTWPQSQRPDSSFYQSFADEFDLVTWPQIQAYVGDPLALDSELSGLGRVTVTMTPLVNTLGGGVFAFVNACDFFPFAASGEFANFSNETEIFYAIVPEPGLPVAIWTRLLRPVASHETKHLVAITDRILHDSPSLDEIWLEEGLAQVSSEIWMRQFNQATWKGNAGFSQTVGCELNLGPTMPCGTQGDKPIGMVASHLPSFFDYLQLESASNSEGLGKDTPSNYGAGWAIARWVTDQYAGNEADFVKALIDEPALTGLPNLSAHTGQPVPLLLVYWNLASAVFQSPTYSAADPRTRIPSFNFADIFLVGQTGLTCGGVPCGLFTDSGQPVFPVQPIALTAGPVNRTVTGVPGTAAAFFLLSAPGSGTEALQLVSAGGGPLSPSSALRVGILRVR
jgi:hypothetical protein